MPFAVRYCMEWSLFDVGVIGRLCLRRCLVVLLYYMIDDAQKICGFDYWLAISLFRTFNCTVLSLITL